MSGRIVGRGEGIETTDAVSCMAHERLRDECPFKQLTMTWREVAIAKETGLHEGHSQLPRTYGDEPVMRRIRRLRQLMVGETGVLARI